MFQSPFSFEGRIRRSEFGISLIIYSVCYAIAMEISTSKSGAVLAIIMYIPMLWFLWAQGAKRCHDLGKSGFWQIIPFYVLWMLFEDGQLGQNEFGENPKGLDNAPTTYYNGQGSIDLNKKTDGSYDSSYDGGHNNTSPPVGGYSNQANSNEKKDGYTSGDLYK